MRKISVITGGAGGMGFATAKVLGKDHHLVICDLHQARLDSAVAELKLMGISCESVICDITQSGSVNAVIEHAITLGKLVSVIHTAGISPQMADPKSILKVNALGTVNIANACYIAASDGFVLVNVASMAAYLIPRLMLPKRSYPLALTNAEAFLSKAQILSRLIPIKLYRNGLAYGISKNFVIWYSRKNAARFGAKGARIVSVSPGTFDTAMGRLEEKSGSVKILKQAALKRIGKSEEIAEILAFCASEKASYLTGIDILCDGGVIAAQK